MSVKSKVHTLKTIEFRSYLLSDVLESESKHQDFIDALYEAQKGDRFILNINSPGGHVDVGATLIHYIQESDADVIARVLWTSASMASIIALACGGLVFKRHTYLMFHDYSSGTWGKACDIELDVKYARKCISGLFRELSSPFLTQRELNEIEAGKDLYICWDDKDLNKRIKRHFGSVIDV